MVFTLLGIATVSGQQRIVVSGLEGDATYRALIEREGELLGMADSISRRMNELRAAFRSDTLARDANAAAILHMEEESFDIRGRMARLASRINAIEQEWILGTLHGGTRDPQISRDEEGSEVERLPANLVYSSRFERDLPPQQYSELLGAQESEGKLPRLIAEYRDGHAQLRALAAEYALAATQGATDSIKDVFDARARSNAALDKIIGGEWEKIFDNKSYAYNYLVDKSGDGAMLERYQSAIAAIQSEQAALRGVCASEAIANYTVQKRMLAGYETAVAEWLGNRAAVDSLRTATAALSRPGDLEELAPLRLRERLLLDYCDVRFDRSVSYSARNPVPEVKLWPRGVIWRILLGTFSSPQGPAIFKGAMPLSMQKGGDGRFRYFAGGFPSDSLANTAVERMRAAGFKNPAAVVWMDGVYIDPASASGANASPEFYNIELRGVDELQAAVREQIGKATPSGGIVRSAEGFIAGPVSAAAAIHLRTVLEVLDPEMSVRLTKISE